MTLADCVPKVLTTARIVLRPPEMKDAREIFDRYAQDPETTKYLSWLPHHSLSDTQSFLANCLANWKTGERLSWVICLAETTEVIGMIDLRYSPASKQASQGFVIARQWWGRGLATEAAATLLDSAFATCTQLQQVSFYCYPENIASQRVLAKIGMRRIDLVPQVMSLPNLGLGKYEGFLYVRKRAEPVHHKAE